MLELQNKTILNVGCSGNSVFFNFVDGSSAEIEITPPDANFSVFYNEDQEQSINDASLLFSTKNKID